MEQKKPPKYLRLSHRTGGKQLVLNAQKIDFLLKGLKRDH